MTLSVLKPAPEMSTAKNGIAHDARQQIAEKLSSILVDNYVLTLKSHLYHWNIVGPTFKAIHDLTEEHYEDLFQASDDLAERVRALGHVVPVGEHSLELSLTAASPGTDLPSAETMISDLVDQHDLTAASMRDVAEFAGEHKDLVTEDLLTGRISFHEKAAWMLRAMLGQ
jgi:starvation-inducible DNA-binding protein